MNVVGSFRYDFVIDRPLDSASFGRIHALLLCPSWPLQQVFWPRGECIFVCVQINTMVLAGLTGLQQRCGCCWLLSLLSVQRSGHKKACHGGQAG